MNATDSLGQFIAGVRFEAIAPELVAKLKDHLLDTLGVACAGLCLAATRDSPYDAPTRPRSGVAPARMQPGA